MTVKPELSPFPAVQVEGLSVKIGDNVILDGVNLTIPQSEIVAIIGPNGSGKTTLLRALLGLQPVKSGRILFFGKPSGLEALQEVAYVPQKVGIESNLSLSVREFLLLARKESRSWFWRSHTKNDGLISSVVEEVGIGNLLSKPLSKLSGGQFQRTMLTFALLKNPRLLLLDEPTAGVDSPGEQTFYELIRTHQVGRALTVVLVSHDLSMVYRHASLVFALNKVVCCEGRPEDVLNADSLKRAYGIHVSPYHHDHHHGHNHPHPETYHKEGDVH